MTGMRLLTNKVACGRIKIMRYIIAFFRYQKAVEYADKCLKEDYAKRKI